MCVCAEVDVLGKMKSNTLRGGACGVRDSPRGYMTATWNDEGGGGGEEKRSRTRWKDRVKKHMTKNGVK